MFRIRLNDGFYFFYRPVDVPQFKITNSQVHPRIGIRRRHGEVFRIRFNRTGKKLCIVQRVGKLEHQVGIPRLCYRHFFKIGNGLNDGRINMCMLFGLRLVSLDGAGGHIHYFKNYHGDNVNTEDTKYRAQPRRSTACCIFCL